MNMEELTELFDKTENRLIHELTCLSQEITFNVTSQMLKQKHNFNVRQHHQKSIKKNPTKRAATKVEVLFVLEQ